MEARSRNPYLSLRPTVLGLAKVLVLSLAQIPYVKAAPLHALQLFRTTEEEGEDPGDPELWLNLSIAAILVLLGGAFAGLTIALMGQVSSPSPDRRNIHSLTGRPRMKYTFKLSEIPVKVLKRHKLLKY